MHAYTYILFVFMQTLYLFQAFFSAIDGRAGVVIQTLVCLCLLLAHILACKHYKQNKQNKQNTNKSIPTSPACICACLHACVCGCMHACMHFVVHACVGALLLD